MSCGKCNKGSGLCPLTFGFALGITCALSVYVWMAWVMMMGMPVDATAHMVPPATIADATMMAGMCFVKGLFFGFFLILFYKLIRCCCKSRCCCKKTCDTVCACGKPGCNCQGNTTIIK